MLIQTLCRSITFNPERRPKDLPRSPILFVNEKDIFLIDTPHVSSKADGSSGRRKRITAVHDPLHQRLPPLQTGTIHLYSLDRVDRMNLCCEIPELGVIVCGSGKGRAVVLSLTRLPPQRPGQTTDGDPVEESKSPTYSFRVEYVLPFASQELEGHRPESPLIGVAAGPVQGSLGLRLPESPRRWRLMLYYHDHTILCYEISRESEARRGLNVEELVV
jgi:hypothetical protein